MNNNDILRRLRYSLDYSDTQVAKIIANIQGKPDAAKSHAGSNAKTTSHFLIEIYANSLTD